MGMTRVSVALAANFTSIMALTGLNLNGNMTFAASAAETSSDTFVLWGSLDASAVDSTNAENLGKFTAAGANPLPAGISVLAATWPYLLVQRTAGSNAGTFYATGDTFTNPAVVTTATPAGVLYSAVMDLRALSASGVRIGGSALLTSSDVFDVFLTQDSTVSSSVGCFNAGRISGGNSDNGRRISVLAKGWPFAIIQRVSGSNAGTIIASGVGSLASDVGMWAQGGNSFGAVGILGTNDAFAMRIIANGITWATSTGAVSAFGVAAGSTTLTGGATTVSALNTTSANLDLVATGSAGSARVRTTVVATAAASATRSITSSAADVDASITVSAATTGRCDTTVVATGVATANTTCTGASGSAASLSAAITGGGTASASVTCTAAVGDGFKVFTGAASTLRLFCDQDGVWTVGSGAGTQGMTIAMGSGDFVVTSTDDISLTALDALTLVGGGAVSLSSVSSTLSLSSGGGASTAITGGTRIDLQAFGALAPIRLLPVITGDTPVMLQFFEAAAGGSNYVSLAAPAALAATTEYTLPVAFPAMANMSLTSGLTGVTSWQNAIQSGSAAIVNGVSTAIAANITATSRIFIQAADVVPGAGALTIDYRPLAAGRVNGLPGSFTITAVLAAGTINVLDQSVGVQWMVLNA